MIRERLHSRSLAGSWRTSPPGCLGSHSRSPATFRRRHSPSPARWLSALTSHSASLSSTALVVSYNFMQRVILMFWSAVAKGKIDEMALMLDLFDLPKNKLYNHEGTANVTWLCDDAYRTLHASTYAAPSHCLWISRGWPSSNGQRQTHSDVSRRQWPFQSSCPQGHGVEEGPCHRVGNVHSYTTVTEQAKASRKLSRPASSSRPVEGRPKQEVTCASRQWRVSCQKHQNVGGAILFALAKWHQDLCPVMSVLSCQVSRECSKLWSIWCDWAQNGLSYRPKLINGMSHWSGESLSKDRPS